MQCYRLNCKETCDEFKKQYCIMKITKEQHDLIANIKNDGYCKKCKSKLVKAIYRNIAIELCTECGVRDITA